MNFKVSAKLGQGKWWIFGSIKTNQWGNLQLSMKNTQQLKDFVNNGGDWLNFSLFEDEQKEPAPHQQAKADAYQPQAALDDEIPFAFILPLLGGAIGGVHLLSGLGLTSYLT